MTALTRRITRRARFWAAFRCREPVLVLESDDWGLRRRPAADLVAAHGRPSGWADEHSETAEDLGRLSAVLNAHRDPRGRPAAMTLNVVTANPDFDAIEASGFEAYHDRPVDETMAPEALDALREGRAAGRFRLQLHGRAHLNRQRWLEDLANDHPGARALFEARVDGGLALVAEEAWRYHSEYLDWAADRPVGPDALVSWLTPALATLERLGGERPRSTVAPHYVVTTEAEEAWDRLGIEFVQAAEYRLRPDGRPRASYLGQRSPTGLVHLTRTARFDPRPGRQGHHVAETATAIRRCFEQHLPAVVDTHRINYTGPTGRGACDELDQLLDVADAAGATYLTTPELGEAVRAGGRFTDWRSGEERQLTPTGHLTRAVTRTLVPSR
jgi:hypothetical protein